MKPALQTSASQPAAALALGGRTAGNRGQAEMHENWPLLARLPMDVNVAIPVQHFRVRDLVNLAPGAVIASKWPATTDVPVNTGQVQLSWAEFEVVEQRLAVRMTRLA